MTRAQADYLAELSSWGSDSFDEHWEAVNRLIADVDNDEALAWALQWCGSPNFDTQGAGLDVLGHLTRLHPELLSVLLEHVQLAVTSSNEDVRWSAAVAMQYQGDDQRTLPPVLILLDDTDSDVRYQAVNALPLPWEAAVPDDHPVVQALLKAMEDPSYSTRDWATFYLGGIDTETPHVLDAFVRHLTDPGGDTAGEAAVALATRGDPRVRPFILKQLADPEAEYLWLDAAAELGDPEFLPLLLQLQTNGWLRTDWDATVLTRTLEACAGPTGT